MQGQGGRAGWTPAGAVPRRRAVSDETRSRSDVVPRAVAGLVDSSRRRQALPIMQDRFSSATRMDARVSEVITTRKRRSTMLKRLRIVGLCLVAVFAVSAVGAASAFASPEWLQNGLKLTSALSVTSKGKLKLTDTKGGLKKGSVTIECTGTDKGTVGPGAADELTEVKATECKHVAGEECPSPSAEAVHLPWKTELYEEGSAIRDKVAETAGLGCRDGR